MPVFPALEYTACLGSLGDPFRRPGDDERPAFLDGAVLDFPLFLVDTAEHR